MGLIPLNERVLTPPNGFQSVESTSAERQLAWPLSEMVGNIIAEARAEGFESPYFSIISGYRSPERQKVLWEQALQKYGSASAARKFVAPPNRSSHHSGFAFDIYLGALTDSSNISKILNDPAYKYMRDYIGPKYNLTQLPTEPWHWECDSACREAYLRDVGVEGGVVASGWSAKKRVGVGLIALSGVTLVGWLGWEFWKLKNP